MSVQLHKTTVVVPKLKDPRIFMSCVLITYTIVGQTLLDFDHQWSQIVASVVVSCVLDILLSYWKTRQVVLPLSGLITGLGLALLVEAIPLWPYIVAPLLAIGSKTFIRFQGQHLFNPSNFGLVALLIVTPATVTTLAAQWSGSLLIVMVILIIGGFTTFRVSRWDLVLSFIGGFCVMALIEELIAHKGLAFDYGPMLGAAFQIFALSMLTDPKTTPGTRPMRIVFGLSIAAVDGILRLMSVQNSLFIALFFIAAWIPLLRLFVSPTIARLTAAKAARKIPAMPIVGQESTDERTLARQE